MARRGATLALGSLKIDAQTAVPLLIEALNDEDKKVRANAAAVLGRFAPEAKEAVPALSRALKDPFVARSAAMSLGKFGPAARRRFLEHLRETGHLPYRAANPQAQARGALSRLDSQ